MTVSIGLVKNIKSNKAVIRKPFISILVSPDYFLDRNLYLGNKLPSN